MKPNEPKCDTWQVLKPGTLVSFATRENAKLTRRRMIRVAGTSAVVVVAGILFSFSSAESTEPDYGGIRCSAVRSKAKDHIAGKLDAATDAKVAQHLRQCTMCASFMKQAASVKTAVVAVPRVHYVTTLSQQE